jgi:hypothetical protein
MTSKPASSFHLQKWYLDFVSESQEVMIFYAARLQWLGYSVTYTSWLKASNNRQPILRQYFRNVQMPVQIDDGIKWSDKRFDISGTWTSRECGIQARIIDMPEGFLDWNCLQPKADVVLTIDGKRLCGNGYAEQLILTVPPWKIPMQSLRWGRFLSSESNWVWIQVQLQEGLQQWLWCNAEPMNAMEISDEHIWVPQGQLQLTLQPQLVLESEKKIHHVVNKIIRYIPGFNKAIPVQFLMADESKWFSHGELSANGLVEKGSAIHEFVNFQPEK